MADSHGKMMKYLQLSLDEYTQNKEEIKKELGGIVKASCRLAGILPGLINRELIRQMGTRPLRNLLRQNMVSAPRLQAVL